jgi:hypothetical protein
MLRFNRLGVYADSPYYRDYSCQLSLYVFVRLHVRQIFYPSLEWPERANLLWTQKLKKKLRGYRKTTPTSVNIIVRLSTVPENAKQLLRVAVVLNEDQVKSDANAMQVLTIPARF